MPSSDPGRREKSSLPSPPGLVIFDCDGVLVDSERISVAVEARVLTELGFPHTEEDVVRRFVGRTSAYQLAALEELLGPEQTRVFDELTTQEIHEAWDRELAAVPGVAELVRRLHEHGVPTCVASSGTHERMRKTLGLTGLDEHFIGRIYSATEVEHGKPSPDLFLHAARSMGVDPSRCVVVEDSVYGVEAAVAAGMTVYGFTGGLVDAGALAEAGAVLFDTMTDLADVLLSDS
ncbi:MAG TPA: HAD family hydrolase [Nocardioidaceae bacterium]|nr:HAD family hydrolase [Nocardioidaceae bacterium]